MTTVAGFGVGPFALRIAGEAPDHVDRFRRLFGDFGRPATDARPVELCIRRRDGRLVAEIDGMVVASGDNLAAIEDQATRAVARMVLDAETDQLHLHAGGVTRDGRTAIIVGPSGSGKSTLVAHLARRGWALLADEQLTITASGEVVGFPRPITLRRESWPLFDEVDGVPDPSADSRLRAEVAPSSLGPVHTGGPLSPTMIVAPDASIDAFDMERYTIAATVGLLVRDTLDLERAGPAGMQALLALACRAPGVRIAGRGLVVTEATVASMIEEVAASDEPDAEIVASRSDPAGVATAWLFIDGSAVLWADAEGVMVELDQAGFESWCDRCGDAPGSMGSRRLGAELSIAGFPLPPLPSVEQGDAQ